MFGRSINDINRFLNGRFETGPTTFVYKYRPGGVFEKTNWTRYSGPRGGRGWRNSATGVVAYQTESPGVVGVKPDSAQEPIAQQPQRPVVQPAQAPQKEPPPQPAPSKQPVQTEKPKTDVPGQRDWSWAPDPTTDEDGDGVGDYSRVGVPAKSTPPPPKIPRLPNLTEDERTHEEQFAARFESDPDTMAAQYRDAMAKGELGDGPNIFGTDDAKMLHGAYSESLENRAKYNVPLHQTANAIAKRAFVQHLQQVVAKMPPEARTILVTAGGVAAGKGYSISKDQEISKLASSVAAIWDSAGEQYSTEMPWVLDQAKKAGASVTFLYVHANPETNWMHTDPRRGVVNRAKKKGRMVDAKLFAESYEYGAKNFAAFRKKHASTPGVSFAVIDNSADTKKVADLPGEALSVNSEDLTARAIAGLEGSDAPEHIKQGGTIGKRVWRQKHANQQ